MAHGLKARSISGDGLILAGTVSADDISVREVEAASVYCLRLAAKRVQAAEAEAAAIIAAAPPTGGADIMEVNTEKSMELRKTVRQFAQNNPEIAAQMVKAWLKGDDTGG